MSREFHEKIAAALDALAEVEDRRPAPAPAKPVAAPKPAVKTASTAPVFNQYSRLTGEDLPAEVADSPAAMEALRKVAAASAQVNELGDPSDRLDRSGGKLNGRTKAERVKEAYALFGDDLIKD